MQIWTRWVFWSLLNWRCNSDATGRLSLVRDELSMNVIRLSRVGPLSRLKGNYFLTVAIWALPLFGQLHISDNSIFRTSPFSDNSIFRTSPFFVCAVWFPSLPCLRSRGPRPWRWFSCALSWRVGYVHMSDVWWCHHVEVVWMKYDVKMSRRCVVTM